MIQISSTSEFRERNHKAHTHRENGGRIAELSDEAKRRGEENLEGA